MLVAFRINTTGREKAWNLVLVIVLETEAVDLRIFMTQGLHPAVAGPSFLLRSFVPALVSRMG